MESKIIAVDISDTNNKEQSEQILHEIQLELFKNGYRWIKNDDNVQRFISNKNYLVLIDKDMYTMSRDSVKYLEKDNKVHFIDSVVSYFRYLKLKKIRRFNGKTGHRNSSFDYK